MKKNILRGWIALAFLSAGASHAGTVANTLYLEARGEGERGLRAVATVIYNRARGNPSKFDAVCLKPYQFSCYNGGASVKITPKTAMDKKAFVACQKIENEMRRGYFKPLGAWTHYFNPRFCNPKWSRDVPQVKIGNHNFLKTK